MISCVEWIPRGVADPEPKRFEWSKQEKDVLFQMNHEDRASDDDDDDDDDNDNHDTTTGNAIAINHEKKNNTTSTTPTTAMEIIKANPIDPLSLPADLRMTEYSDGDDDDDDDGELMEDDDEDEDEDVGKAGIGKLLIGNENSILHDEAEDVDTDDDDDDDDDLADVPDTREYMPTDIEGMEAMRLDGGGGLHEYEDGMEEDEEDNASDLEDTNLKADDALIVVAKTEEDFAALEVHVYEQNTGNLFVHHDIPLPSFPLCLSHGTINPDGNAGNYIAVGTFDPAIEIWNLDVLDVLEPTCILGGKDLSAGEEEWKRLNAETLSTPTHNTQNNHDPNKKSKNRKKKKKQPKQQKQKQYSNGLVEGSHTDAIMALSWNTIHRQVLASGSADTTVKLWDVTSYSSSSSSPPVTTLHHHTDKVQSVCWHPSEGSLLATGSYDRTVCLLDARTALSSSSTENSNNNNNNNIQRVHLSADCESISWDPHSPYYMTVATEDGRVTCWDVRQMTNNNTTTTTTPQDYHHNAVEPVWSFLAHASGGCGDVRYNPSISGMMATCGVDGTVALWDVDKLLLQKNNNDNNCNSILGPQSSLFSREMKVGKLYSLSFYPSSPWLMGCGGSGNEVAIWDFARESPIVNTFGSRIVTSQDGEEDKPWRRMGVEEGGEEVEDMDGKEKEKERMAASKASVEAAARARENAQGARKKKKNSVKKATHHKTH